MIIPLLPAPPAYPQLCAVNPVPPIPIRNLRLGVIVGQYGARYRVKVLGTGLAFDYYEHWTQAELDGFRKAA